ncbi:hypothetical protein [Bowmanella denitrificans]|nr:hypothetical protein [Bowmanella denitrificans]
MSLISGRYMKQIFLSLLLFCSFPAFSKDWHCFSYENALRGVNNYGEVHIKHKEYVEDEKRNKVLDRLFHEDQQQRRNKEFTFYQDIERAEIVFKEYKQGRLNHYCDFYQAAIIFMHHPEGRYLELASELAGQALALGGNIQPLRWLRCASEDRLLWHLGKPQIWGTQEQLIEGQYSQEPFDTSAVTEENRNSCFDGL